MEEIDLKELFDYYKSKIVYIIMTIVAVIILGNTYMVLRRIPMYKSDTTIVLVSEKQGESYNTTELQLNKNLVGTYSEIIKSRKVLETVIKNLNLDINYEELKTRVNVSSVVNTEIIKITVSDDDSKEATLIANNSFYLYNRSTKII